jgi:plasmid maintenance system killer protein
LAGEDSVETAVGWGEFQPGLNFPQQFRRRLQNLSASESGNDLTEARPVRRSLERHQIKRKEAGHYSSLFTTTL